jgi:Ni/Co efflux regulator RcnB
VKDFIMKMTTATRVAALAVGLSLAGATAFAAPHDGRRGDDNDTNASDQQKPGERGDRDRKGRKGTPDGQTAPAAAPAAPVTPQTAPRMRGRQGMDDRRRGRDDVANDRRRDRPAVRNDDRRRDYGDRNDRRYTGDRNDRRRDYGDRNDRRDVRGTDDRRRVDVRQYRRNYDAPRRYRVAQYRWRDGYSYNRYSYGQRLPRNYYGRNYWLTNFLIYGLFSPPEGYVWVRYGPDALLIDEYTGEIVQVRYNMFYS